ncbi:MAG: hypothetical protein II921_01045 [Treponema sp.]|nr:hypothetical protein [Treponema sp.]
MNFVCVCGKCSRTIDREFIYCPWCGERNQQNEGGQELIDDVFDQLEKKQVANISRRIASMKTKLSELEEDLGRLENLF